MCAQKLVRRPDPGRTLVASPAPTRRGPADGLAIDFVVLPDRARLGEIVTGCGRTAADEHGNVATLEDGVAAFNPTERIIEETIIRGRPQATRAIAMQPFHQRDR